MSVLRRWRDRLRGLFRRQAVLRDIDDELRSHLELAAEEHRRRGLSPEEARAAAAASFGDVAAVRDSAYDVRGGGGLESVWHDLRFAARTRSRNPAVTASALLTWALGIGATVAVFSVVHPVLLRGLPFAAADRLVSIRETCPPKFSTFSVSAGNFLAWREHRRDLELVVAVHERSLSVTGGGDPERVRALAVTPGFFELYGVAPRLGRGLVAAEDVPGDDAVAVISHGLWQRRFAGDPGAVGRQLVLDDRSHTVVGVMPPELHPQLGEVDLWIPTAWPVERRQNHGGHFLRVVGRLAPGATAESALAGLNRIAARLEEERPDTNGGWRVLLEPLSDAITGDVRPTLIMLVVAVAFVLLIAASNVASLLLGRTAVREREIAVRAALGAGRGRILRQLACESLLLSLLGGAVGLVVAVAGVDLLLALAPRALGHLASVKVDATLCAFTIAASTLTGLLVALVPARLAVRGDLISALRSAAGGSTGHARPHARRTLVVVEIAACMLLVIGAGLLVRSLGRLVDVDPGFRAEGLLKLDVSLPRSRYPDAPARAAFVQRAIAEVATLPGVEAVAMTQSVPFINDYVFSFWIEGRAPEPPGKEPSANHYSVTPAYFGALGIRLLAGRLFDERDGPDGAVMLVNERLARTLLATPGDAVGKRLRFFGDQMITIVGVVSDVKQYGLSGAETYQIYEPMAQRPWNNLSLLVRGARDPTLLAAPIRARIAAIDGALPVAGQKPMHELVVESLAQRRFAVALLGVFAAVALALAVVGIYGVIADAVVQRTREIGVRVALGATPRDVLRSMMGVGVVPALIGIVVGLGAAAGGVRLLRGLLYGVSEADPLTWIAAPLVIALVAALASYLPARRAMRVDPMTALRFD